MAMHIGNTGQDEPDVMIEMNATPLIDVMMVLLIMLIITIPAQLHSVNLDMPAASKAPPKTDPVVVRVEVSAGNVVSWNGKPLADRTELEARLRGRGAAAAARNPHPLARQGALRHRGRGAGRCPAPWTDQTRNSGLGAVRRLSCFRPQAQSPAKTRCCGSAPPRAKGSAAGAASRHSGQAAHPKAPC